MLAPANVRLALLAGKAGVGKSMFLLWLAASLYEEWRTQPAATRGAMPVIFYQPRPPTAVATAPYFLLGERGATIVISGSPDYFFSDDGQTSARMAKKLTLLASSDEADRVKEFNKRLAESRGSGWDVCMPSCEKSELQKLFPAMSDDELQFRFDVLSGNLRTFNSATMGGTAPDQEWVDLVEEQLAWMFGKEYSPSTSHSALTAKQVLGEWAIRTIARQLAAGSKKPSDQDANPLRNFLRAFDVEPNSLERREIFASPFLGFVTQAVQHRNTATTQNMLEAIFGSGVGYAFEYEAHRSILGSQHPFIAQQLQAPTRPTSGKNKSTTIQLDMTKKRKVLIRKIDDIKELKTGDYGLPSVPNFPLVDAVIKPDICLQMTTSSKSHKGAVARLQDIAAALRISTKDIKMVFVVRREALATFQYDTLLDCDQYVMSHEPEVATRPAKKQKSNEEKSEKA